VERELLLLIPLQKLTPLPFTHFIHPVVREVWKGYYVIWVFLGVNLYATGFKWLQSTFTYDIIFDWHLDFCKWFTKKFIGSGTKKDLIMDLTAVLGNKTAISACFQEISNNFR